MKAPTSLIDAYYKELRKRLDVVGAWLDHRSGGIAGLIYRALDNFQKRGLREAAALSYYALFSLFPLVLLVIVIIGWLVGPAATKNQVEDVLAIFMPGPTATELNNAIARFVEQGSSASVIALIGLAWSAIGLFSNLESALSRTFRDTQSRPFVKRRIVGVLMILALGVLLIANILTSLIFSFLNLIFLTQGNIWLEIAGFFVPFGFGMGVFAMLYRWIPRSRVGWDAIWPSALLGAVAWEAAKRLFVVYLERVGNLSVVYGSITTVIILMLWTYFTACIILLCGEFCVSLSDWLEYRRRERPERHDFAMDYYEIKLRLPDEVESVEGLGS
jgi:membrane protein